MFLLSRSLLNGDLGGFFHKTSLETIRHQHEV